MDHLIGYMFWSILILAILRMGTGILVGWLMARLLPPSGTRGGHILSALAGAVIIPVFAEKPPSARRRRCGSTATSASPGATAEKAARPPGDACGPSGLAGWRFGHLTIAAGMRNLRDMRTGRDIRSVILIIS